MRKNCPYCGLTLKRYLDYGLMSDEAAKNLIKIVGSLPGGVGHKTEKAEKISPPPFPDKHYGERIVIGNGRYDLQIAGFICPQCGELTVDLYKRKYRSDFKEYEEIITVIPAAKERPVPAEVPPNIASDYKEASKIMDLSYKGSSTLIRRCLQATLRHAYPDMKRAELFDEIGWVIENKSNLKEEILASLHFIRKLGNFGAHPEKDGLTEIYELNKDDLDTCFMILDNLFDVFYVQPAKEKEKLSALKAKVFPAKS